MNNTTEMTDAQIWGQPTALDTASQNPALEFAVAFIVILFWLTIFVFALRILRFIWRLTA